MRLLHTRDLKLVEFVGTRPHYAILSHTWENDEFLFADIANLEQAKAKAGYTKVQQACQRAIDDGLQWIWIDTCCIDKSSSAELSEALNSMFQWYEQAAICYAYISDMLPEEELAHGLRKSRWVTRGWTLQELIAPKTIWFFDRNWCKRAGNGDIHNITQIDPAVLYKRRPLSTVSVAYRMSWAASRITTRIEDKAYSLLGIFGVNMPMLYGEGDRAFLRLQQEIIKTTNDLSIFAWTPKRTQSGWDGGFHAGVGLLAPGPDHFTYSRSWERMSDSVYNGEFSMTNSGIKIQDRLKVKYDNRRGYAYYVLGLGYGIRHPPEFLELGIPLCQCGPHMFARVPRRNLDLIKYGEPANQASQNITLFSRSQFPDVEPIYIVASPGPLRAQGARKGAFLLNFAAGIHSFFNMDDIEAQPRTHFDRANNLFFTLQRPGFVGQLRLPQSRFFPNHEPISIICGLSETSNPSCTSDYLSDYMPHYLSDSPTPQRRGEWRNIPWSTKPWCMIGTGKDPFLQGWPIPVSQMLRRVSDGAEGRSAIETCVGLRAFDHHGNWQDVEINASIVPGTFPGLGDEPAVQVYVVQVVIRWGSFGSKMPHDA